MRITQTQAHYFSNTKRFEITASNRLRDLPMQLPFSRLVIPEPHARLPAKRRTDLGSNLIKQPAVVELPLRQREIRAIKRAERVQPKRIMMNIDFSGMGPLAMIIDKDRLPTLPENEIAFGKRKPASICHPGIKRIVQPARQSNPAIQRRHSKRIAAPSQRHTQKQCRRALHGRSASIDNQLRCRRCSQAPIEIGILLRERDPIIRGTPGEP